MLPPWFMQNCTHSFSVQNYIFPLNYARKTEGNVQKSAIFQKSGINILVFRKIFVPLHPLRKKQHRGVEQLVARQAHNLEVARSNPASATTKARMLGLFSYRYAKSMLIRSILRNRKKREPLGIHASLISLANSIRFKNACEVSLLSFHLCQYLLVIAVCGLQCVLNAPIP